MADATRARVSDLSSSSSSTINSLLLEDTNFAIPMTREFSRKEDEYDIKERLIQTLEKHIKFLEEELRRKDTIITLNRNRNKMNLQGQGKPL